MEVSSQHHAPAALPPRMNHGIYTLNRRLGWAYSRSGFLRKDDDDDDDDDDDNNNNVIGIGMYV